MRMCVYIVKHESTKRKSCINNSMLSDGRCYEKSKVESKTDKYRRGQVS